MIGPLCRLGFVAILIAATTVSAAGQTSTKQDSPRDEFAQELAELAESCDAQGLVSQAATTRKLIISPDPNRQYFFLPAEKNPWPDESVSEDIRQWSEQFRGLRKQRADTLFAFAQEALAAGHGAQAYACLYEVCVLDPDHPDARRILGYRKVDDRWLWSTAPTKADKARSRQPMLGWLAGQYIAVESAHYQIASLATLDDTVRLAEQLERWRVVWRQAFFDFWSSEEALREWFDGKTPMPPTRRLKVFLFANRDQYIAELTRLGVEGVEKSTGFYSDRHQSLFLYMDAPPPLDTWMHEQAHQLFQESASARKDPVERSHVWALEGIAMYFESLVDGGHFATLGGFDHGRLQYARINWTREGFLEPFDRLTSLGREEFQTQPNVGKLYSQSAGMTHFLMSEKYRPAMQQLIQLVYQRKAKLDSLETLCSATHSQLEAEYKQFLAVDGENVKSHLTDPRRRTELALGFSNIDSSIGPALAECRHLRWLQLSRTAVNDELFPALGQLTELEQLFLDRTGVTDKILSGVSQLSRLEELDLADTQITDDGLREIAKLTGLKALWLGGTAIGDAGLEHLSSLTQLQFLDVQRTQVTPEALRRLKQQLPQLK